jgi:hypothetical protein
MGPRNLTAGSRPGDRRRRKSIINPWIRTSKQSAQIQIGWEIQEVIVGPGITNSRNISPDLSHLPFLYPDVRRRIEQG